MRRLIVALVISVAVALAIAPSGLRWCPSARGEPFDSSFIVSPSTRPAHPEPVEGERGSLRMYLSKDERLAQNALVEPRAAGSSFDKLRTSGTRAAARHAGREQPKRIVSLIPAVTEMIFAMGEGARLVGVSNYDRYPPQVATIEHVGGLLDPNVERILSLRPDLVIVYNTQQELKQRLDRASIPYYSYEHRALPDVMATLRAVGARIGSTEAERVASRMESDLAAIRRSVAGRKRPRTLLVFGREAGSLRNIDASGGYGFLHDMLDIAGGDNVFADVKRQSVQATIEMILSRRPDVIIELRYDDSGDARDMARELTPWNALSSVPAVRNHQVHALVGNEFVVPGPRIVNATRRLAQTLHPETAR